MDTETKRDMESMAEWASTMDAYDRLLERRAQRHRSLRFWFSPWQVADDPANGEHTHRLTVTIGPDVPVPASGAQAQSHTCAPAPPGAGTRAAGSNVAPTTALSGPPHAALAEAFETPLASGSRLPGGPHHF